MPRPTLLLALAAVALAGCLHAATVPVNLVSRADFPPAERDAVWSRALTGMHATGLVTTAAEGDARIAMTELPPTKALCRRRQCDVVGTLQILLTPVGTLSARYNRTFSGEVDMAYSGSYERLLLEDDVAQLQLELDAWVAELVDGKAGGDPAGL